MGDEGGSGTERSGGAHREKKSERPQKFEFNPDLKNQKMGLFIYDGNSEGFYFVEQMVKLKP